MYTLLGDSAVRNTAEFRKLAALQADMIASYRARDWDGAERALTAAQEPAQAFGMGGLYELYAERIAAFRAEPPPPDWTGVYVALSK